MKIFLLALGGLVASCGVEPRGDGDSSGLTAPSAIPGGEGASDAARRAGVSLSFTADYEHRPADIIVLRENSDVLNSSNNPFAFRLFRQRGSTPRSFMEFAVQLYFSGIDYRLAFMEALFANDSDAGTKAGGFVTDPAGDVPFFAAGEPGIIDAILDRAAIAPGSSVSTGVQRNNGSYLLPLTALLRLLDRTDDPTANSYGFLRDEAFLSIIYVGYMDPIRESIDTMEVVEALDATKGEGGWMISVLAPPRDGCEWQDSSGQMVHTDSHRYAANSSDPNAIAAYTRRNKMIRLQEYSGGLFTSICEESYSDFMGRAITEGTHNAFFSVELTPAPKPETVQVWVADVEVGGWRYNPATQSLRLPTTITPGTDFLVTYEPVASEGAVYERGVSEAGDPLDGLQPDAVNPKEVTFLADIRDILQNNGCIGCHGAYGAFQPTWNDRAQIMDRISRPAGDPLRMPLGGDFDSEANRQALLQWLVED